MAVDIRAAEIILRQMVLAVRQSADCRLEQLIISESGPIAIPAPEQYTDLPEMLPARLHRTDHRRLPRPAHGPARLVSEPVQARSWSAAEEPADRVIIVAIQNLGMAEAVVAADILLP